MTNNDVYIYEVMELCLLAGKIMLESGAETYRVEDTMARIAVSFGIEKTQSYVTPTGIIISLNESVRTKTKLMRILTRTTDLDKITKVNSISRKISNGELTVKDATIHLEEIDSSEHTYPLWLQVVAASIASGCFLIMFDGKWIDFIPAVLTGGLGYFCSMYFHQQIAIRFFAEFLASILIGLLSILYITFGLGMELNKIIIGSVMPLVPGLLLTNAVRDLMSGHLVSGLSKGAEAFLTAFAIGAGIAVVFSFI